MKLRVESDVYRKKTSDCSEWYENEQCINYTQKYLNRTSLNDQDGLARTSESVSHMYLTLKIKYTKNSFDGKKGSVIYRFIIVE